MLGKKSAKKKVKFQTGKKSGKCCHGFYVEAAHVFMVMHICFVNARHFYVIMYVAFL